MQFKDIINIQIIKNPRNQETTVVEANVVSYPFKKSRTYPLVCSRQAKRDSFEAVI